MYHLRLQKPLEWNQLGFFFVEMKSSLLTDIAPAAPYPQAFEHLMQASKVYTYKQTLHRKYAERKNLPIYRNTISLLMH